VAGQVLSLFARPKIRDWSQQELAEFYRVESALARSGLRVETDRGLSDEGEPWFVFCRVGDGEVVIHFAKCDGQYIVAGPAYERIAKGLDFTSLVRDLVSRHPLVNSKAREGSNVILHPTALLVAIVAAALLKDGEAQARSSEPEGSAARHRDASDAGSWFASPTFSSSITVDIRHLAVVMSAVAIALPTNEPEWSEVSHDRPALIDGYGAEGPPENRDSVVRHAYGLDQGDESLTTANSHRQAVTPEQKLEIVSLTSILLDLSTKEVKSAEFVATDFATPSLDVGRDFTPPITTLNSDGFLKIDLVKGSGELPSIQGVVHLGGEEGSAVPIDLSVLQSFLDHTTHVQGAARSAVDVLQPLSLDGTIDANVFGSLKNDLSAAKLIPATATSESATPAGSHPADVPAPLGGMLNGANAGLITNAIEKFVREEHYKVSLSNGDVIFYDPNAFSSSSPDSSVRSVTWEFADGSSITLIGHLSHLPMELMA